MGLWPISGIPTVDVVTPAERQADLARVSRSEFRQEARDEQGAESRKAARGMENEDAADGSPEPDGDNAGDNNANNGTINFFA